MFDIKEGAGPTLHFLTEPTPLPIAETLVAFANTNGGRLVIGVDSDGKILGHPYNEKVELALKAAEELCNPPVLLGTGEQVEIQQKPVVIIRVPRSLDLHALTDGRVLVRTGTENRPLGGHEIRRLAIDKATGDLESEVVPGATLDNLDADLIEEFIKKRVERTRRPWTGTKEELLIEVGACNERHQPTTAGILLFAAYPQQWLPQSSVIFVKFAGTEPHGEEAYAHREEVTGPLVRIVETAWKRVWGEMTVSAVIKGLERIETYEYPPFAVREALINAIAHRDYRVKGSRVEIRMFADRLEIISPGGLPGFITVNNMLQEHFSRNPRLVAGLFQWGYIEELGLGIDKMIETMQTAGHPPPLFEASPYSFSVRLYNTRHKEVGITPSQVNVRQARALAYVREHGSITNREYRQLCEEVGQETLRLDLADLVDKGLLVKLGSKKGTYYIIK